MNTIDKAVDTAGRRRLLKGTLGVAAAGFAASAITPALGKPVHLHKMRFHMEGDVRLDWALSLYIPPGLAAGLPPGTAARLRVVYPARHTARHIMAVSVFLAPAGVPAGIPAPEIAPISVLEIAVEEAMLAIAAFGEESTRPSKNVGLLGRVVSNEIESPFGSLVHRLATASFGFVWGTPANDDAVFRLVAIGAAGSHMTVVPEAAGEIAFS